MLRIVLQHMERNAIIEIASVRWQRAVLPLDESRLEPSLQFTLP
jgi:hypothetical protein